MRRGISAWLRLWLWLGFAATKARAAAGARLPLSASLLSATVRSGNCAVFGANDQAQLGLGAGAAVWREPALLEAQQMGSLRDTCYRVAAGRDHSAVVTTEGMLWTFGANARGQLGHGDKLRRSVPTRVLSPARLTAQVTMVAAGGHFCLAVRAPPNGEPWELFTFGANERGASRACCVPRRWRISAAAAPPRSPEAASCARATLQVSLGWATPSTAKYRCWSRSTCQVWAVDATSAVFFFFFYFSPSSFSSAWFRCTRMRGLGRCGAAGAASSGDLVVRDLAAGEAHVVVRLRGTLAMRAVRGWL